LDRWLITGASGQLGGHVLVQVARSVEPAALLALAGHGPVPDVGAQVERADLADAERLRHLARDWRPTHVIHMGAMTAVQACYEQPRLAEAVNVHATAALVEAAAAARARLVYVSTDMVFDGSAAPYAEDDEPRPLSRYGRTKHAAEQPVLEYERGLVVRVPLMYGYPVTSRETTFVRQMRALRERSALRLFTDEFRTPVALSDAARALIGLAGSEATGVLHISGPERLSRYELIERCAQYLGIDRPNLVVASRCDIGAPEPRPADLSLDGSRLASLFPALVPGPVRREVLDERPVPDVGSA